MEDGVKEDLAQSHEPKFLAKAGWLKKAHGRLLASYKERFVHVEKTELVVYDNEDLLNCLERLDLENFDKCHELKSPFTKKHRLILIRTAKPGNKVHDLKFQAFTAEEKEAWIKALTDGISRAKNKVFDEVKVDESSNLEHVTRTRPKGNRNRRPPTRIHMKEVADVSSDGILRLDLDLENAVMPNGTYCANVDGTEKRKEATVPASPPTVSEPVEELSKPQAEEEAQKETQSSPKKKIIKPPMPPIKEAKPISALEEEPDKENESEKKVLRPPVSPSKEHKPSTSSSEETSEEAKAEKISEKSPDAKKKVGPPPTPPNKPTSQANIHPPTPPSKENKPSHFVVDAVHSTTDENKEKQDNKDETTVTAKKTETPTEVGARDDEDTDETLSKTSHSELLIHTEPLTLSSSPLNEGTQQDCTAPRQSASDNSGSSLETEDELPKTEVPSVVVTSNDLFNDSVNLKAEEKSVDSGQHSDGDSEGSENEDTLVVSTAALRGSHAALDVLDSGEGNVQISIDLSSAQVTEKQQVKEIHCWRVKPTPPLKPSSKVKSASIGDLLSDSPTYNRGAEAESCRSDDVMNLETEVAVEMEKTSALLRRVSQSQKGSDGEGMPEDLLAKAMEKLKMADHVLKEVKKLKLAKNLNNRKSL